MDGGYAGGEAARRWGIAVVRGRSMEPTLADGDRLLVRYGGSPRAGRIAVVQLPERSGLSVKRLGWRRPDGWWVERDNPREGVDSWLVGPVEDVIAIAVLRVWPWPRLLQRHQPRTSTASRSRKAR